ncbi:hypothetical protein MMC26_003124 [Xylographa opegraphella]|nr:hypothetical protein [Xylographa opegraphella]
MSSTPLISKTPKVHSCILCRQRRVRCDRQQPCSNCVKAGAECRANNPAPPNRAKKGRFNENLSTRIRSHKLGVPGESVASELITNRARSEQALEVDGERPGTSLDTLRGKFIVEDGKSRYVDSDLWTELGDEFQDPQDILGSSSFTRRSASPEVATSGRFDGSTLLLQQVSSDMLSKTPHPSPLQIFRLWQSYLDNVHPLTKLLHGPTMQHQVLEASADSTSIPKNIEPLLFAIYTAAITSLRDAECQTTMGERKAVLLARYASATEKAMVRADFLQSADISILQAFVLLLLAMRRKYHRNTLFILTGVAVRIAQTIGVHRDGAALGLAIFESEMRRRLWWQILQLDGQSTNRCGLNVGTWSGFWNSKIPSNLNDSDLYPGMETMPAEHIGATEMIFCLVRATFAKCFKDIGYRAAVNGSPDGSTKSVADKERIINELETDIKDRFLRFCDPSIPLHILVDGVARSAISALRLTVHHPRQYPDKGASMPQEEKDMLFRVSLNMIELGSSSRLTEKLMRFLWHMFVQFQFDVFVYLLGELRIRTSGELVERAWHEVELAYKFYPEFLDDRSNAFYAAIRNLTLKAWQRREAELVRVLGRRPKVPAFVETLRSRRRGGGSSSTASTVFGSEIGPQTPEEPKLSDSVGQQFPAEIAGANIMEGEAFEMNFQYDISPAYADPMDWDYWMDLIQDNELQVMAE